MTAVLHLTNSDHPGKRYAIEQGATFRKVSFLHERDLTGWTIKGEIRTNYRDHDGEVIAEFDFDPLEYKSILICGQARMRTVIVPQLSSDVTQTMGVTWVEKRMVQRRDANDLPQIGRNVWVYDIGATNNNERIRVSQGYAEIDLEVTDTAKT